MRKKLLSILLMMAMALTMIPMSPVYAAASSGGEIDFAFKANNAPFRDVEDETRNIMYVTMKGGKSLNGYKVEVKGPEEEKSFYSKTIPESGLTDDNVQQEGMNSTGSQYYWQAEELNKPGDYTATVSKDDDSCEKTITLIEYKFHIGNGDTVSEESLYTGDEFEPKEGEDKVLSIFGTAGTLTGSLLLPKLNDKTDGNKEFIGWNTDKENNNYKALDKLPDDGDNNTVDLYPVYGTRPVVKAELVPAEDKSSFDTGDKDGPFSKTFTLEQSVEYGKTSVQEYEFQLKNTGNTELKNVGCPDFTTNVFTLKKSNEKPETVTGDETNGYNIPKDGYVGYTLKFNQNLEANQTHSASVHFRIASGIATYTFAVKVTPKTIQINASNIEKTYGETKGPEDVKWSVEGDSGDKIKNSLTNLTFTSDGFSQGAKASGEYPIEIAGSNGNYKVEWKTGTAPKVEVSKAKPVGTVTATGVKVGENLSKSKLSGTFANGANHALDVPGELKWEGIDTHDPVVSDKEDTVSKGWTFTPEDTENYETVKGSASIQVTNKTPTVIKENPNNKTRPIYDGKAHSLSFTAGRNGTIKVEYSLVDGSGDKWVTKPPVKAGQYKVKATIAGDDTYADGVLEINMEVAKRKVYVSGKQIEEKPYDGKYTLENADEGLYLGNIVGNDQVLISGSEGVYENVDVGTQEVKITPGNLTGKDVNNYVLSSKSAVHAEGVINPKEVTVKVKDETELTKEYGQEAVFNISAFDADGMINGEKFAEVVNAEFMSEGAAYDAKVDDDGYDVEIEITGGNYTATNDKIENALKVEKATPVLKGEVTAECGYVNEQKTDVKVHGLYVNPYKEEMVVDGTFSLTEDDEFEDFEDDFKDEVCHWEFELTDTKNYNKPDDPAEDSRTVTVRVMKKKPVPIDVSDYNKEYTGDKIDLGLKVGENGEIGFETKIEYAPIESEAWVVGLPKNAGIYKVRITAYAGDESDTYADNSVDIKAVVEKVKNYGTEPVFNGYEGQVLGTISGPTSMSGVKNETVTGTFHWYEPDTVITKDGESYAWTFTPNDTPNDQNYDILHKSSVVNLKTDDREIPATIYNLPEGYADYAVLALNGSELKEGDTVGFYRNGSPVSAPVTIGDADIKSSLIVELDENALTREAGRITVQLQGEKKKAQTVSYPAEVGSEIADVDVYVNESVTISSDKNAKVTVDNAEIAKVDGAKITGLKVGTARATVTAVYDHPDSGNHSGEKITITRTITVTVSNRPSSGGSSSGGGGSGGGSAAKPEPEPEPQPSPKPEEPLLTPETTVSGNEAKAEITEDTVTSGIEAAKSANSENLTVAPEAKDGADKMTVELPKSSMGDIADAGLNLTVETDAADVTLPTASLEELNTSDGGKVSVSVEKKEDGTTGIEVAVDGNKIDSLKGGLKAKLPVVGDGNVLVIVEPDGTETVVKKSVVDAGYIDALLDGSCSVKVKDNRKAFDDVAGSNWFAGAVDFASSHDLFQGVADKTFAPKEAMTRGMLSTVLWRLEDEESATATDMFSDVANGSWYTEGIAWANEHGIVTGYGGGAFGPNDNITREQLATMLWRYAGVMNMDMTAKGNLGRFSDSGAISGYAADAMTWAVGAGLLEGSDTGLLNPDGSATRAEVATIMQRMIRLMVK